jgi:hypothetical protein
VIVVIEQRMTSSMECVLGCDIAHCMDYVNVMTVTCVSMG